MKYFQRFCVVALAAWPLLSSAQSTFPDRTITMVVPFSAGGSVDVVARRVGAGLSSALGRPVIIDNKPGAGGTIGAAFVAKAAPDGHTLMFATSSALAVSPALYKKISYDTLTSFEAIGEVTRGSFILSTGPDSPFNSVADVVAYAKKNPGKLNYGSAGLGSAHHLAMETFKQATDITVEHVPYKGSAPAWAALLSGEIQLLFDSMPGPLLYPGKVKPIAVTANSRLPKLAHVPTFAEQGLPKVDNVFFFGLVAPANTPPAVVAKLNAALNQALENSEVRSAIETQGLSPSPGSPAEFRSLLAQEVPRFRSLVQKIGLSLD